MYRDVACIQQPGECRKHTNVLPLCRLSLWIEKLKKQVQQEKAASFILQDQKCWQPYQLRYEPLGSKQQQPKQTQKTNSSPSVSLTLRLWIWKPHSSKSHLKSQCAEGLQESLTQSWSKTKWTCPSPCAQANGTAPAARACSEELKSKGISGAQWSQLRWRPSRPDRDRKEQGTSPGRDGGGWRGCSDDRKSAPKLSWSAVCCEQLCTLMEQLPQHSLLCRVPKGTHLRGDTWDTYFVYSLLRSVLPGLWCLWLWQRQLLLNSTHGEPNMMKPY